MSFARSENDAARERKDNLEITPAIIQQENLFPKIFLPCRIIFQLKRLRFISLGAVGKIKGFNFCNINVKQLKNRIIAGLVNAFNGRVLI